MSDAQHTNDDLDYDRDRRRQGGKAKQYIIRVGHPEEHVSAQSSRWGWCRTLDAARRRAARLSRSIRSDCRVGIEVDGEVIEESGTCTTFCGQVRPTNPVR